MFKYRKINYVAVVRVHFNAVNRNTHTLSLQVRASLELTGEWPEGVSKIRALNENNSDDVHETSEVRVAPKRYRKKKAANGDAAVNDAVELRPETLSELVEVNGIKAAKASKPASAQAAASSGGRKGRITKNEMKKLREQKEEHVSGQFESVQWRFC